MHHEPSAATSIPGPRRRWLAIAADDGGDSVLTGPVVADQTALYGLLGRLRDLHLPLQLVVCREDDGPRPDPRVVLPTWGERSAVGHHGRGAGEAPGPHGRPGGGPAGAATAGDEGGNGLGSLPRRRGNCRE